MANATWHGLMVVLMACALTLLSTASVAATPSDEVSGAAVAGAKVGVALAVDAALAAGDRAGEPGQTKLTEARTPEEGARAELEASLFGEPSDAVPSDAPGQNHEPAGDRDVLEEDLFGQASGATDDRDALEEDLFGGGERDQMEADLFANADVSEPVSDAGASRDAALLGGPSARSAEPDLLNRLDAMEDPLAIGGLLYTRAQVVVDDEDDLESTTFRLPTLMDVYLDARPNDRVRAFARGRLSHDSTVLAAESTDSPETLDAGALGAMGRASEPTSVSLDQLWLKFDIAHRVYLTIGRQPVRWGTGRFWNPSDVLNAQARDPLAVLDERLGVSLVKVHIPVERLGSNLYLVANFEGASDLSQVGGALRNEWLFGLTELALTIAKRKGDALRIGADVSTGVGLFDLRLEAVVKKGGAARYWEGGFDPASGEFPVEVEREDEWLAQVVAGAEVAFRYSDEDSVLFGAEAFYNQAGYDDASVLPWLMFQGDYVPLYAGRLYGALYAMLAAPGSWNDTTFIVSTLGNLSDPSLLTRFDARMQVLTYLSLSAWTSVFYGNTGEFRMELELPPMPGILDDGLSVAPPRLEAGLGATVRF